MAASDVRGVSSSLFRGKYRLELIAAIANWPRETVHAYELAESLGISETQVSRDLKALIDIELLEPQPRPRGSVAHPLKRVDHPFWLGCAQLAAESQAADDEDGIHPLRAATA